MGLDMYLMRAILHGYTPEQAEAANSYFSMMEHNAQYPEKQYTSIKDWADQDDSLLEGGVIEAFRSEYKQRYMAWDIEKRYPEYFDVFEQVGHWRKAYGIYGWFIEHVQDGYEDFEICIVSKEQLEELKSICESVLACNTLAETLLPPDIGLMYGSTKYDEYYYRTLQSTVEIIDKVIAETNWDVETVCYQAS